MTESNEMKKEIQALYTELHGAVMSSLTRLEEMKAEVDMDRDELADTLYVLDRAEKLLEEHRKTVTKARERAAKLLMLWMNAHEKDKVQTRWCTASLRTKLCTRTPSALKEGELYRLFLTQILGVNNDAVIDSGVVNIHFPKWEAMYTAMCERGEDLPPELASLQPYDTSTITVRKRKDLLETD